MGQDKKLPHERFVVFGVGRKGGAAAAKAEGGGPGTSGDRIEIDETLHRDSETGPEAGSARGSFTVNESGDDATGEVTLHFTDPPASNVKAAGTLTWNPSGKFGVGTLDITGGMTGKLKVTVVNPKRYSHEP